MSGLRGERGRGGFSLGARWAVSGVAALGTLLALACAQPAAPAAKPAGAPAATTAAAPSAASGGSAPSSGTSASAAGPSAAGTSANASGAIAGAPPSAGGAQAGSAAPPAQATVRLGSVGSVTDAGFFIGLDRGYFKEQAIELDIIPFDSAARMVAPLSTGQLEAGGGSHSAGLFNAVGRSIDVRLVADKGSTLPGYGFQALLFRRDLAESGQLRGPADLKGMRVGISARGTSGEPGLLSLAQSAGVAIADVDVVELPFPEHGAAFAGRTLDASVNIEPFLTRMVDQGVATIYSRFDELIPNEQIAEVIYSGQFAKEQPDVARRFMVAYLRAVRDYNDAFTRGDAAKREQAVATLTQHTSVKEPALYQRMVMPGLNPEGRINVERVAAHQDFWVATGLQQARVNLDEVIDHSFADAAVRTLGPYR